MNNPTKSVPKIAVMPASIDEDKPFDGDLFERKALANRLTAWIDRLPEGGVLGIDAPWGGGKSWFGRNWHALLRQEGRKSVYVDAFAADYVSDPFLLLVSELSVLWKGSAEAQRDWTSKAVSVGRVLAPAVIKGVGQAMVSAIVGKETTGAIEKAIEAAGEAGEDAASAALSSYLGALSERKKTVESLKEKLASAAVAQNQPIVIFIDELDRCRPDFAVTMLERVKHFFEIPGVVFVLLLNRDQLEGAVRATYGAHTPTSEYLHRFVTLFVTLPKDRSDGYSNGRFVLQFVHRLRERLGYPDGQYFGDFCTAVSELAPIFGISYRDIERMFAYFGLLDGGDKPMEFLTYLIALRVKRPIVFRAVARADLRVLQECYSELTSIFAKMEEAPWCVRTGAAIFDAIIRGGGATKESQEVIENLLRYRRAGVREFLILWARQLDIQVQ